jgi:hypothetical protein
MQNNNNGTSINPLAKSCHTESITSWSAKYNQNSFSTRVGIFEGFMKFRVVFNFKILMFAECTDLKIQWNLHLSFLKGPQKKNIKCGKMMAAVKH